MSFTPQVSPVLRLKNFHCWSDLRKTLYPRWRAFQRGGQAPGHLNKALTLRSPLLRNCSYNEAKFWYSTPPPRPPVAKLHLQQCLVVWSLLLIVADRTVPLDLSLKLSSRGVCGQWRFVLPQGFFVLLS